MINNIVNCNFDHNKCLRYIADICENNYENNLYAVIIKTKIEKNHKQSSCIYSNINNER